MKFWRQSTPGLTGIWKPTQVDKVRIPGMTTISVSTSGLASTPSSGWAELTSDGARLEGIALFRLSTEAGVQEATVRGAAAPAARFDIPFDNRSGFVTSLAIANPDSSTINTQWAIRDSGGRVLASELISLEGGGHLSFELPRRFPASQGASGTIQVTSPARSLYILPLRFNSSRAFTSLATQPE
jgi:hypothetical protein